MTAAPFQAGMVLLYSERISLDAVVIFWFATEVMQELRNNGKYQDFS